MVRLFPGRLLPVAGCSFEMPRAAIADRDDFSRGCLAPNRANLRFLMCLVFSVDDGDSHGSKRRER